MAYSIVRTLDLGVVAWNNQFTPKLYISADNGTIIVYVGGSIGVSTWPIWKIDVATMTTSLVTTLPLGGGMTARHGTFTDGSYLYTIESGDSPATLRRFSIADFSFVDSLGIQYSSSGTWYDACYVRAAWIYGSTLAVGFRKNDILDGRAGVSRINLATMANVNEQCWWNTQLAPPFEIANTLSIVSDTSFIYALFDSYDAGGASFSQRIAKLSKADLSELSVTTIAATSSGDGAGNYVVITEDETYIITSQNKCIRLIDMAITGTFAASPFIAVSNVFSAYQMAQITRATIFYPGVNYVRRMGTNPPVQFFIGQADPSTLLVGSLLNGNYFINPILANGGGAKVYVILSARFSEPVQPGNWTLCEVYDNPPYQSPPCIIDFKGLVDAIGWKWRAGGI